MMNLAKPQSAGGNYLKLENGENRIRIVSHIIDGWESWADAPDGSRKVFRQKDSWKALELVKLGVLDKRQKQLYAAIVWNYNTEQFECMVQTQKSIKEGIFMSYSDADWGNPNDYDIVIKKSGSGLDTTYNIIPKPKSKFKAAKYIPEDYCLENLYGQGDPFSTDESKNEIEEVEL